MPINTCNLCSVTQLLEMLKVSCCILLYLDMGWVHSRGPDRSRVTSTVRFRVQRGENLLLCDRDAPVPEASAEFCFSSTCAPHPPHSPSDLFMYEFGHQLWQTQSISDIFLIQTTNIIPGKITSSETDDGATAVLALNALTQMIDQVLVTRAAPGSPPRPSLWLPTSRNAPPVALPAVGDPLPFWYLPTV